MSKLLIISALIWAAVILLASYWYSDTENYKYLFGVLLTAGGFHNVLIYDVLKKLTKSK